MSTKPARKILDKDFEAISFGGFLRAARTMQDKNQTQMAQFLGISKGTLCDIEKGRQLVSFDLAAKIAKKCGLYEPMAVQCAIQDQFRKYGLKLQVEVRKAA